MRGEAEGGERGKEEGRGRSGDDDAKAGQSESSLCNAAISRSCHLVYPTEL